MNASFRLTGSIYILLFMFIVMIVEAMPVPGLLFMFLAAPLWPTAIVNFSLALMAYEAVTGKLPRFFLVLPVAYFSIYALATILSHMLAARESTMLTKNGDFTPIAPDERLIVDHLDKFDARRFLSAYNINSLVDVGNKMFSVDLASRCSSAWDEYFRSGSSDYCIRETLDNEYREDGVVIKADSQEPEMAFRWKLVEKKDFRWHIHRGTSRSEAWASLASPLTWLPAPYFGCTLIDQPPVYKCFGGFMYEDDYRPAVSKLIAQALGAHQR